MNCLQVRAKQERAETRREKDLLEERRRVLDRSIDTIVYAAMLVLVEEFGFGVRPSPNSRLQRFLNALTEKIGGASDFYEQATMEGLRAQLENRGFNHVLL